MYKAILTAAVVALCAPALAQEPGTAGGAQSGPAVQPPPPAAPEAVGIRSGRPIPPQALNPRQVEEIQKALFAKGAGTGRVDGNWGPDVAAAVREFQRSENMISQNGDIDSLTLMALGLDPLGYGLSPRETTGASVAGDAGADVKADDANAHDAKADDAKAHDAKAHDPKADDVKADDVKAGDVKAGDQPQMPPQAGPQTTGEGGAADDTRPATTGEGTPDNGNGAEGAKGEAAHGAGEAAPETTGAGVADHEPVPAAPEDGADEHPAADGPGVAEPPAVEDHGEGSEQDR